MLELPHTLVGAAIATRIPNPLISLPLALLSHFLLDFVPHWNPSLYTETQKHGRPSGYSTRFVFLDSSLSLILGFLVAARQWPDRGHFLLIILCCFLAVAPDVLEAPYFFLKYRPAWMENLIQWQRRHQGRARKVPGILIQLTTIAAAVLVILL